MAPRTRRATTSRQREAWLTEAVARVVEAETRDTTVIGGGDGGDDDSHGAWTTLAGTTRLRTNNDPFDGVLFPPQTGEKSKAFMLQLDSARDAQCLLEAIPRFAAVRRTSTRVVVHIAIGSDFRDYAPIEALRGLDFALLYSGSPDQALVNAKLAHYLAAQGQAVVHWFDQVRKPEITVDLATLLDVAPEQNGQKRVNGHAKSNGRLGNGKTSVNGANGHDHDDESQSSHGATRSSYIVDALTRHGIAPAVYTGSESASTLLVSLGATTSVQALIEAASGMTGVAFLQVALLRPSCLDEHLPRSALKRVIVLEQASPSRTTKWSPLFLDVLGAMHEREEVPEVISATLGSVADTTAARKEMEKLVHLDLDQSIVVGTLSAMDLEISQDGQLHIPKHEQSYSAILATAFANRLQIINAPNSALGPHGTSPEFGLGRALALIERRQAFINSIKKALGQSSSDLSTEAHKTLSQWVNHVDDPYKSAQYSEQLLEQVKDDSSALARQLTSHGELLPSPSQWIIGSDAWAYDIGSSGVHHALATRANVNMLIIDSTPMGRSAKEARERRKKDIGLYAMNYGGAYVASVAVYSSYTQVLHAFMEADRFQGPSIILAYLPYEDDRTPALEVLQATKVAIDSGYWPLYRWDPSVDSEGGEVFRLDSEKIKTDLRDFLDRDNHLTQLVRAKPELSTSIAQSEGTSLREVQKRKAREAFENMLGSLDGPPLLILFASDGGNAEKVAKRLMGRAKARGLAARLLAMDEFPFEDLALEKHVTFITSTAGQGEFPQNGRDFWKALNSLSEKRFSETKFAVFALGDSHYWPRPEDAHYYNKPGKDLDNKLEFLSAERLIELGMGDDQDPDGFETAYKSWEPLLWKAMGVDHLQVVEKEPPPITNEHIKIASNYLRGTIKEGLVDESTGSLAESDGQLTKFHGIYQQDDRDLRDQRKSDGLEPAYSFMVRVRLAGGVATPEQWLAMDAIADEHGNETMKMTTRQTWQFHGIVKKHLKPAIQAINQSLLNTIAACGDVNRNVMCAANPSLSPLNAEVYSYAKKLSDHLLPSTSAYAEIWLDKKMVAGDAVRDFEPLYGPVYLPRKFKIGVAIPPHNDVDVFTNDVGLIAIAKPDGSLKGFNFAIGGGMGVTHSNKKTYPRLGDVIGFVRPDEVCNVAEKIMLVQRDWGNRENRKNARLKYTIDRVGLDVYKAEVEKRLGYQLEPAEPFEFTTNVDTYGWQTGTDGRHHFLAFIENGRIIDEPGYPMKTGLREIAKVHKGVYRLTPNQHLMISDVTDDQLPLIKEMLAKYKLDNLDQSNTRLYASACVAFPTCGLAMAESERYLPLLVAKVESLIEEAGLRKSAITMRMTGCPNGCARPWVAEIAFVGKAPGSYVMLLGGAHNGTRLNKMYKESVDEKEILETLRPMFKQYAVEKKDGETFGDWTIRAGIVPKVTSGLTFHD